MTRLKSIYGGIIRFDSKRSKYCAITGCVNKVLEKVVCSHHRVNVPTDLRAKLSRALQKQDPDLIAQAVAALNEYWASQSKKAS